MVRTKSCARKRNAPSEGAEGAESNEQSRQKRNKKQKQAEEGKFAVAGIPGMKFIGIGKKQLIKIGLIPSYNATRMEIGRLYHEANAFALEELANILKRIICITLHGKRKTITLEDVNFILESLPHSTELPPLPAGVTERRGSTDHVLPVNDFLKTLNPMVTGLVNTLQDTDEYRVHISKCQASRPNQPMAVQGSAQAVMRQYLWMCLVWWFRDTFIAKGFVGMNKGEDGKSAEGGSDNEEGGNQGGGEDIIEGTVEAEEECAIVIDRGGVVASSAHNSESIVTTEEVPAQVIEE
jgi:hypothetical protein